LLQQAAHLRKSYKRRVKRKRKPESEYLKGLLPAYRQAETRYLVKDHTKNKPLIFLDPRLKHAGMTSVVVRGSKNRKAGTQKDCPQ